MFDAINNGLFNAQFLSRRNTHKLLSARHTGVCVNGQHRLSFQDSTRNVLVVGPVGSGKSSTLLAGTLLNNNPLRPSIITTDPSRELYQMSSGYLSQQGYDVQLIDLGRPNHSLYYNPLHNARDTSTIKQVAHTLVSSAFPQHGRSDGQFWNLSATELLTTLIRMVHPMPERYRTLGNVRRLLDELAGNPSGLNDFAAGLEDEDTFRQFRAFLGINETTRQSILATARASLEKLTDESLARLTSRHSVDFQALRQRPTALFVTAPEDSLAYFGFMLSLIFTDLLRMAMKMPEPGQPYQPILCLMDEFAHLGLNRLENFPNIAASSRKRDISLVMVCQDMEQIMSLFGREDGQAIINGTAATHIFLSGQSSTTTARWLSERMGDTTMSYDGLGGKTRESHRALMTVDEIMQLPPDQALMYHAGLPPVLLKMRPYFKNRKLLKRSQLPPVPVPQVNTSEPLAYVPL